jgi:SAM-dependent methyltransferase
MQLEPIPADSTLAEGYSEAESDDYVDEEAGQRYTARRVLDQIEAHVARPGSMADLGCWVGFLLAEARDRGWRPVGVEPSQFASAYARDHLGLEVFTTDLFDAPLEAGTFSAVTMGDVIEHLTDPGRALTRIHDLLAPSGVLWLALPDAGSMIARVLGRRWWSVLPTHVQYFTRDSLRQLLERCGFDVLEIGTAPKWFSVGYYVSRVGGYSPALGRTLLRAARAAGVADRMWGPDFRDRMAVVARRREA